MAALYLKTPCSFRKPLAQGSSGSAEGPRAFQGREGLLLAPSIPHHSRGRARKKHHAPVILRGVDVPGGEDVQGQNVGVNE